MAASSAPVLKRDFVRALRETFLSPADRSSLARLIILLDRANRRNALGRVLKWCLISLDSEKGASTSRSTTESVAVASVFLNQRAKPLRTRDVARLCKAFPLAPEFWLKLATMGTDADTADDTRQYLRRATIVDPSSPDPYMKHGIDAYAGGNRGVAETLLRRNCLIRPQDLASHEYIAQLLFNDLEVDSAIPARFLASLQRCLLLDPTMHALRLSIVGLWRRTGDWETMEQIDRWTSVAQADPGQPGHRTAQGSSMRDFAREFDDLGPLEIERDFPATVLNCRVLIHPRLPHDGPWRLSGPVEQCNRAKRILTYVNPTAQILGSDESTEKTAQILSLIPCADPDAWYMPCLVGHWQVYWTVLPAILDTAGRPNARRMVEYSIKTRQFITFWYAKGHERKFLTANRKVGEAIASRLADEASRDSYLETLSMHRPSYVRHFFERICHRVQYFDYAVYRPGDVILNLGVAEGFEVPAYLSLIAPGGVLHNIDPEGYGALGGPARIWIDGTDCTVKLHKIALSDVDGEIEMDTGGCWEDSRISKRKLGRLKKIQSRRLDSFIAEEKIQKIDHIKLDIEGGEGFLLDQLIDIMNTFRPQIEISIYHTVEQFIVIPARMMKETENYRFYFYHYCGHFGEGTLYAIPAEIEPLMPIKP